jgi:hypothetical protein
VRPRLRRHDQGAANLLHIQENILPLTRFQIEIGARGFIACQPDFDR